MTTLTVPYTDVEAARTFLRALHADSPGYVTVNTLNRWEEHAFSTYSDALAALEAVPNLDHLARDGRNAYISVCSFREAKERGRGHASEVVGVPGVWADLDACKPGYALDEASLLHLLSLLPPPTVLVSSGSGGKHAYWLYDRTQRVASPAHRYALHDLSVSWQDYVAAQAASLGFGVDSVGDLTRILRLPGTIRWPKADATELTWPRPVTLDTADGPRYKPQELLAMAEPVSALARAQRDAERAERQALQAAAREGFARGNRFFASLEAVVNETLSWDEILLPAGWTRYEGGRVHADGVRYWVRPGKDERDGKSASTDFNGSCVMTLYTTDPASGLAHLEPPLTKYTVAVELLFNGDERAFAEHIVSLMDGVRP